MSTAATIASIARRPIHVSSEHRLRGSDWAALEAVILRPLSPLRLLSAAPGTGRVLMGALKVAAAPLRRYLELQFNAPNGGHSIMRWRNGLLDLSSIAKTPVSHGVGTPRS
jgi:hypothetical protein